MLEIERYRGLISEIEGLYRTKHQVYRNSFGGNPKALYMQQPLLADFPLQ